MWIVFGLVALIVATGASWIALRSERWSGTRDPRGFEWKAGSADKSGRIRLRIAVPAPAGLVITLRPERAFDRLGKALGIAVEFEVGQADFDRRVFIESDNPRFWMLLKYHAALRTQVMTALDWKSGTRTTVKKLHVGGGYLVADIVTCRDEAEFARERAATELLPALNGISAELGTMAETHGVEADRFASRAALVLALTAGIAIAGLVQGIALNARSEFVLEHSALVGAALLPGLILFAGLLLLAIRLVGRTSRAHVVLAWVLGAGFSGSMLLSAAAIDEANEYLDTSATQEVSAVVASQYTRSGKGGPRYYVRLDSDDEDMRGRSIQVHRDLYNSIQPGQPWRVDVRAGGLGIRWAVANGPVR